MLHIPLMTIRNSYIQHSKCDIQQENLVKLTSNQSTNYIYPQTNPKLHLYKIILLSNKSTMSNVKQNVSSSYLFFNFDLIESLSIYIYSILLIIILKSK